LIAALFAVSVMYFRTGNSNRRPEETVADRTRKFAEQTQAAIPASQSKSDFLAKMSHEIQTPINTIMGMTAIPQKVSDAHPVASVAGIFNDAYEASDCYDGDCAAAATRRLAIDGLDVENGIREMGGSEQSYRELLAIFREDILDRLDILREAPGQEDLQMFVTQVHALKSAAANVKALSLSADAARLEDAGKRGDIAAIRKELDPFREALIRLAESIRLLSDPD
jgi:HPt (histidine-containing phosphotransfer) domain-containing protein